MNTLDVQRGSQRPWCQASARYCRRGWKKAMVSNDNGIQPGRNPGRYTAGARRKIARAPRRPRLERGQALASLDPLPTRLFYGTFFRRHVQNPQPRLRLSRRLWEDVIEGRWDAGGDVDGASIVSPDLRASRTGDKHQAVPRDEPVVAVERPIGRRVEIPIDPA